MLLLHKTLFMERYSDTFIDFQQMPNGNSALACVFVICH